MHIQLGKYTKAIGALAAAFWAAYQLADADNVITGAEWRRIAIGAIVTGVLVWAVPNRADPLAGTGEPPR